MKSRKPQPVKRYKTPEKCPFCTAKKDPDYKEFRGLDKYLSDRAKIYGSVRTGTCAKHQRMLTIAVKRARHLGLLPFTPSL